MQVVAWQKCRATTAPAGQAGAQENFKDSIFALAEQFYTVKTSHRS